MQFREFLAILGSRWKTVLVSLLLVVAATVATTLRITPTYEATTRVFFSAEATAKTGTNTGGGGYVLTTNDLGTYEQLVSSPVVMDPLRQQLKLAPSTPLNVTAKAATGSPMLDITATSSSPRVAADAANAVGPQLASIGKEFAPLLNSAGQGVKATTITPATVPSQPVSPNLLQNIALGVLAGLALGIGLALLRHFLDTRVRSELDLRAVSDRPILGALRLLPKGTSPTVMSSDPHGVAAEEYRRLRTNLQFADVTTGGKHSFVISSVMPGEGKTTTAVNLAIALADSGANVVLVDGDLRNPSVAKAMGLEGNVGLTTVLLGRATVAEAAQKWGDSSLHVLPSGAIPPNPSELLGSTAMETLFAELLQAYDYVLVDSPPVLPVIDPILIDRLVGGMLMVISVNTTLKRDLAQAVKQLRTVDAKVAGFALNRMPNDDSASRYGGYYAYGRSKKDKSKREAVASRHGSLEEAVPVTSAAIPGSPSGTEQDEETVRAARTALSSLFTEDPDDTQFSMPAITSEPVTQGTPLAAPAPASSPDETIDAPSPALSRGRRFAE
ncbi:polysaccharide biosynthesis tyrosine autokinase [Raineyella fluvialis]|uniref:non-specific protein-tyrosine kinase n=1 Tax=Raineyella fluvialis TaxID=2662261 RepID=A0A5Q2FA83_9ACTN|nr:polysaccharide biosynthesis tyrosine autokinase [Raineyella fluvialis]QGF23880.1 polysaccharide biosynthesis tyrosine autokinase [Raineyella fluvialis]